MRLFILIDEGSMDLNTEQKEEVRRGLEMSIDIIYGPCLRPACSIIGYRTSAEKKQQQTPRWSHHCEKTRQTWSESLWRCISAARDGTCVCRGKKRFYFVRNNHTKQVRREKLCVKESSDANMRKAHTSTKRCPTSQFILFHISIAEKEIDFLFMCDPSDEGAEDRLSQIC